MHALSTPGRIVAAATLACALTTLSVPAGANTVTPSDDAQRVRPAKPPPVIPLPAPRNFQGRVDNPYSPFIPGSRWVYAGGTADEPERIVVKVLHWTKRIEGITATVVRDTATVDGELVEDTFDWFAQDRRGRVWYLGEATKEYENGQVVSTEGSWKTGVDGAKAGIVMFAHPEVGVPYRQEFYAGHAEDQAEFLTLDTRVATTRKVYRRVRMTEDTTPLDSRIAELKFYAPGVGVVLEFDLAPDSGRTELLHYRPAKR